MAISDAVQTLSAAFSFGILLQAAVGALLIYSKSHGATIFKDGRRLVLVLFLSFAALWAQIDFLNLLITAPHSSLCQVALVFSTAFDQLARSGTEQFLLWSVGQRMKTKAGRLILQTILGLRLIAGGILVGFTRPDFAPVCIAQTSVEPVAIVVIALDCVIIGFLLILSVSSGIFRDVKDSRSPTRGQSKWLILTTAGFIAWTSASVLMMLGLSTTILLVKTVVPANGLLILIGILTISSRTLLETREQIATPEAQSPFAGPSLNTREMFREEIGNGSPRAGPAFTGGRSLFVVNPSSTPRDSAQGYFPRTPQGFSKQNEDIGAREPTITGHRVSSGYFPKVTAPAMTYDQGSFASQIKPSVLDTTRNVPSPSIPLPSALQKKSLLNRSKHPVRSNVRALGISKPIIIEDGRSVEQPFARMPMIDLAAAAANDRERRAAAADRSRLVAHRPAPPPPKGNGVQRKEKSGRALEVMPTVASSISSKISVEAVNGSTSSASLSLDREEVRRRSPRTAGRVDSLIDEKARHLPTLQRKQTLGLPSNPRARMAPTGPIAKEQTVLSMKDIVYDNPAFVKIIMKGASEMYAASRKAKDSEQTALTSYNTALKSSDSIIHRPRPCKRDSAKDRALFPSEASPRHHGRSKSTSSIISRKSIYMTLPGSPTRLPPIPPPPTSASKLRRLFLQEAKSMTVEENIELLFPAPPGATLKQQRRSSVPSLPCVTSTLLSDVTFVRFSTKEDEANQRSSKRTTIAAFDQPIASFQVPNVNGNERHTFRFRASPYAALAEHVDEIKAPRSSIEELLKGVSSTTRESKIMSTGSDDGSTYWGSIHSEIPTVNLSAAMRNANSTYIRPPKASISERRILVFSDYQGEEIQDGEEIVTVMLDCEEGHPSMMTAFEASPQSFLLDAEKESQESLKPPPRSSDSWHRRIGDQLPTFSERRTKPRSRKMPPPNPLLLHQRARLPNTVVRAEPSPPLIDSPQRAIAEIQAQLRRLEDSGTGSLGALFRHLPEADSSEEDQFSEDYSDRLKLLENLEFEIGQQQNQWQQMQTNLDRDSMSTIRTPSAPTLSEANVSRESSQRSSRPPSRAASQQTRIKASLAVHSQVDDEITTISQITETSRACLWQRRLAEAQLKYMENVPSSVRKQSVNFLSVAKSHQLGSPTPPESVDSRTDIESDSEVGFECEPEVLLGLLEKTSLWNAPLVTTQTTSGLLWTSPGQAEQVEDSPEPPSKNMRPRQSHIQSSLSISSFGLWIKPDSSSPCQRVVGLWGSQPARLLSIKTRPVTQKPARRLRRVTLLPDIVESPLPLPSKRDTLGIFQFPWGETSDSAVYQPVFRPRFADPILNARPDQRSRQLEPGPNYSSSFFDELEDDIDDYEITDSDDDSDETTLWEIASLLRSEEFPSKNSLLPRSRVAVQQCDKETDFEDSEAGEVYQTRSPSSIFTIMPLSMLDKHESQTEITESITKVLGLWTPTISSFTKSLHIGLPHPASEIWDTYTLASDTLIRTAPRQSKELPTLTSKSLWAASKLEKMGSSDSKIWSRRLLAGVTATSITPDLKETSQLLWVPLAKPMEATTNCMFSLDTQRSKFRSTQAEAAAARMIHAPRASTAAVLNLLSQSLWSPNTIFKKLMESILSSKATVSQTRTLWTHPAETSLVSASGLFSFSEARSDFRTSAQSEATNSRKPRSINAPLSQLTSNKLWQLPSAISSGHHWITESSIRPSSPSIYSEISSSPSSLTSERSPLFDASIMTTSTKASSLWGNLRSTPTWWSDEKGSRGRISPTSKIDNVKLLAKLPAVRDSRVLVISDVWEAKTPVSLGETPKRNLRRSLLPKNEAATAASAAAAKNRLQLHRPKATSAMWHSALDDAIAKGHLPTVATKAVDQYHPAVLHPVFFISSLLATTDIHPATIGHVEKPQSLSLWTPRSPCPALNDSPVGPMWLKGKISDPQFENDKTEAKRNIPAFRSIQLPALESSNLWHPTPPVFVTERNWISTSQATPNRMWIAPQLEVQEVNRSLWKSKPVAKAARNKLFAHITSPPTQKAAPRSELLPLLTSHELFAVSKPVNTSARHWLHETSGSIPAASWTWRAPSSSNMAREEAKILWSSPVAKAEENLQMLQNPYTEPWNRVERSDSGVDISDCA